MPDKDKSLSSKGSSAIKLTIIGKQLRKMIVSRENEENEAIIQRFIDVLLNRTSTRYDLFAALQPTPNSTISNDILHTDEDGTNRLLKFSADGTLLLRSLTKPLREAYKQAEAIMRTKMINYIETKFKEQVSHTEAELLELDKHVREAENPFKTKFKDKQAEAA